MRIAVVGSGAMGAFYGALLARAGYDVHFLMRSDYQAVRRNGLTIRSCRGDFHLAQVNCYNDPRQIGPADLVFVGLKTTENQAYQQLITPMFSDNTLILTAQNGLGNTERLAELFGPDHIAGGLAFLCCNRQEPGVICHLDYGQLRIGNFQRPGDTKLSTLGEMLNKSSVECQLVDNLALAQWDKLVWNVPFNGLSTLLDKTVDKIFATPPLRRRAEQLMQEVQTAAATQGLEITDALLEKMMTNTEKMAPYFTSMHLDARNGRPLEVEAIIGEPLRRGLAAGADLPALQQLYDQLTDLDQANRK